MADLLQIVVRIILTTTLSMLYSTLKKQAASQQLTGFSKSIAYYDLCARINDSDPEVFATRAWIHLGIGQQAESLSWIDKALRLSPDNENYISEKAQILWEVRGTEVGIEFLQNSLKLRPKSLQLQLILLRMVRDLKMANANPSEELGAKLSYLVRWLTQLGGHLEGVDVTYDRSRIRGAAANRFIPGGSSILSIPLAACIYTSMYHPSKEVAILRTLPDLDPKILLSFLLLIEESTPHSTYAPYLDLLPYYYQMSPLNFTRKERDMLAGTYVLETIDNELIRLNSTFRDLVRLYPSSFNNYTFDDLKRAYIHVSTRALKLSISNRWTLALVPYMDILNYQKWRDTIRYSFDQKNLGAKIEVRRHYHKGEDVKYYVSGTATELFRIYGMASRGTAGVAVKIVGELSEIDRGKNEKLGVLRQFFDYDNRTRQFSLDVPSNWTYAELTKLLTFFRIRTFEGVPKLSLANVLSEFVRNGGWVSPISRKNEIRAMDALYFYASLKLREYPTTVDEDNKALKEGKPSFLERSILLMRSNEKTLLNDYMEYAEAVAVSLEMDYGSAMEYLNKKGKKTHILWAKAIVSALIGKRPPERIKNIIPNHFQ